MPSKFTEHRDLMSSADGRHRVSAKNFTGLEGKNMQFDVWKDIIAALSKVDENVAGIVGSRS
jgi:hypothetical protein